MTVELGPPFVAAETWIPRDEWRNILLTAALDVAVPTEMRRIADWTPQARIDYAREQWVPMTTSLGKDGLSGGAELMFGGRHCAAEFATLARVLAALAYQPGGVMFAGMHWCADHEECEKAAAEAGERIHG